MIWRLKKSLKVMEGQRAKGKGQRAKGKVLDAVEVRAVPSWIQLGKSESQEVQLFALSSWLPALRSLLLALGSSLLALSSLPFAAIRPSPFAIRLRTTARAALDS